MALWPFDPAVAPGICGRPLGWLVAVAGVAARGVAQGAAAGLRGGSGLAGQDPDPVLAGQAVAQQGAQVDRGAPLCSQASFLAVPV
jgi:hypothetical protein